MSLIAVFDIGKTNAKLTLVTTKGEVQREYRRPNTVLTDGIYPQVDVDGLWEWLCQTISADSDRERIDQFVTTTHGATAALVSEQGLCFPIMDYEWEPVGEQGYAAKRPPFSETCSPQLPAGLNLGRQIDWLANRYPDKFAEVKHILMYPQYWAWRMTGRAVSEVTSLGCHTDLWSPLGDDFSSLVNQNGWRRLFPEIVPADAVVGQVTPEVALQTGLPAACQVIAGIHDSNASLLPYLKSVGENEQLTVLSSGTWLIMAGIGGSLSNLDETRDMLANVNAYRQPVACARFMGGREFAELAGTPLTPCSSADLQRLMAEQVLALPAFAESGGPFMGRKGRISSDQPLNPAERYALATLYLVCMTHYCLNQLESTGRHVIEGGLANNPFFAALLAGLDANRSIVCSNDLSGTTGGALRLCQTESLPDQRFAKVSPLMATEMVAYYQHWYLALQDG